MVGEIIETTESPLNRRMTDAVPKKRGPKTDVLEALLKRVNGLEERLKDEKKTDLEGLEGGEASEQFGNEADALHSTQTKSHEKSRDKQREEKRPTTTPAAERILL